MCVKFKEGDNRSLTYVKFTVTILFYTSHFLVKVHVDAAFFLLNSTACGRKV